MKQVGKAPRRYEWVTLRVSRVEKARLHAAAAEADVTVAEYVRTILAQATDGSR